MTVLTIYGVYNRISYKEDGQRGYVQLVIRIWRSGRFLQTRLWIFKENVPKNGVLLNTFCEALRNEKQKR